jgi:hypothetical protein
VNNATIRYDIYRDGAWYNAPLRSGITTGVWYTDTITAPTGGWTDAIIDAMYGRFYYNQPGADKAGAYLYLDVLYFWVNYTPPGINVTTWGNFLPLAGLTLPYMDALKDAVNALRNWQRYERTKNGYMPWGRYTECEWMQLKEGLRFPRHFDLGGQCA